MIQQNKEINYSKIADKETQNLILEKLNEPSQDNNSEIINNINSTTLNTNEKISALDTNLTQVSKSISGDGSTNTGYGTGAMGSITYNASTTVWPALDAYGRYVWNCTNFTLPEGVTMIPPEKNNGLYIYCTGTCTINGTINTQGKRLTLNGSNGITSYITIKGNKYYLAKGGNTVKGGNGGGAGQIATTAKISGGVALNTINAGHINGGGNSSYGTGALAPGGGEAFDIGMADGTSTSTFNSTYGKAGYAKYHLATGAIIIASKKLIIGSNGNLNCKAVEGVPCKNGGDAKSTSNWWHWNSSSWSGHLGNGGDGAIAPSGGGCITIITESFTNSGKLNTSGSYLQCSATDGANYPFTGTNGSSASTSYDGQGGTAGKGGTFISTAGEIKIYIIGG